MPSAEKTVTRITLITIVRRRSHIRADDESEEKKMHGNVGTTALLRPIPSTTAAAMSNA